jgi:hypothetical protein
MRIFDNPELSKFLSFLIGLGMMIIFFERPNHTKSKLAVNLADIEGKVVSYGGKCYRYHAEDIPCEILSSK